MSQSFISFTIFDILKFLAFISCFACIAFAFGQTQEYIYLERDQGIELIKTIKLDTHLAADAQKLKSLCNASTFIQKNHRLERRITGNDPYYNLQNYAINLNVAKVWDKYTGGLTRGGNEIIVAIVDDGIDTLHEDLKENIFVNTNEIPWNGIDDDGNGYVDDQYGWNGADSNGKVNSSYGGTHGTPIAGIIGAKGNNDTGITGLNWKIKMLNLSAFDFKGFGGDVSVANCFEYILHNKRLYKTSSGVKGINTSVISLSIGIADEFPKDNPIWCAYIDSFALHGIMLSNAVPNVNKNIDVSGDIPSTCPSLNLISVNNGYDKLASNSAFGTEHVDIAADGQNVLSTAAPSRVSSLGAYDYVSGASFSSPQVAGVMALTLSATCQTFHTYLKDSVNEAIVLFRSWVLNADTITALKNKNARNGRLNAFNVLLAMDEWCMANDQTYNTKRLNRNQLGIYPNPLKPGQTLHLNIPVTEATIYISTSSGRMVHSQTILDANLKLETLVPGFYQIQLIQNGKIYQSKLIVH